MTPNIPIATNYSPRVAQQKIKNRQATATTTIGPPTKQPDTIHLMQTPCTARVHTPTRRQWVQRTIEPKGTQLQTIYRPHTSSLKTKTTKRNQGEHQTPGKTSRTHITHSHYFKQQMQTPQQLQLPTQFKTPTQYYKPPQYQTPGQLQPQSLATKSDDDSKSEQ